MYPNHDVQDILYTLIQRGLKISCILHQDQPVEHADQFVFCLGNAYYGLSTEQVCTIQPLGTYTPLPFVHRSIVGTIATHQGRHLLVVDLRILVDMVPINPHPKEALIIVALQDMEIGLLIEKFSSVPAGNGAHISLLHNGGWERKQGGTSC